MCGQRKILGVWDSFLSTVADGNDRFLVVLPAGKAARAGGRSKAESRRGQDTWSQPMMVAQSRNISGSQNKHFSLSRRN
jgi:hypothetical protein